MNLSKPDKDPEDFIKNIGEFHYEPSVGEIFTTWYARYQDIYENRTAGLPNEMRITMLLRKFSKNDHDLYLAYLLPLSPKDFTYEETIEKRFKCLDLAIREGEDIHMYAATVNRMCNAFSYGSLKEDQFRCLLFIQGLRSPCNAEIRLKLLSLLDKNPDIMVHHLADEYNYFRSLIADSNMPHPQSQHTNPKRNKPKCRFCGDFHFHRDCPFYKHRCQDCNSYGHKEGFCQSSQRRPYTDHRKGRLQNQNRQSHGVLITMQENILSYRLTPDQTSP
ncbi:unnamed protein product [Hymenolepis diminuta]|uniref:DUF7083 domain-containing protein n=1 Tax=Hymenolepis diminuta TaxID=6216 RepID=A0A564YNH0_HYMDI|nr:unnamed protein product [Hymenolepis diminuta]